MKEGREIERDFIEIIDISINTTRVGTFSLDKRAAMLLAGAKVVYDTTNDTFVLIAAPTEENVMDAYKELLDTRQRKKEWAENKVRRY